MIWFSSTIFGLITSVSSTQWTLFYFFLFLNLLLLSRQRLLHLRIYGYPISFHSAKFMVILLLAFHNLSNVWINTTFYFSPYLQDAIPKFFWSQNTALLEKSFFAWKLPHPIMMLDNLPFQRFGYQTNFTVQKGYPPLNLSSDIRNRFLIISLPQGTSKEVVSAHDELVAKWKITLLLRSNVSQNPTIKAGDLVQVYFKHKDEKRGTWLCTCTLLLFDPDSEIINVLHSGGRPIRASEEDVRLSVIQDELAQYISESNDQLNAAIDAEISGD